MGQLDSLGGFQQLVMVAVLRLAEAAYGARIQEELDHIAGRTVTISTVYVTLERLEKKGFVTSWLADPTPVRGGKAKRYYRLTPHGLDVLRATRAEANRMWADIEGRAELGSR